VTPKVLDL